MGWDVAPRTLTFQNIAGLHLGLDWCLPNGTNQGETCISDIRRQNHRLSRIEIFVCWDYEIVFDVGLTSFSSTGFEQVVHSSPTFSQSQYLGRPHAGKTHETECP